MADRARAALVALSAVHAKTVADLQVARAASRAAAEERDRALAEKDEALAEVALLAANAGAAVETTPGRAGFAEAASTKLFEIICIFRICGEIFAYLRIRVYFDLNYFEIRKKTRISRKYEYRKHEHVFVFAYLIFS